MSKEVSEFYESILNDLFNNVVDIISYNVELSTVFDFKKCDLLLISSTSYDLGKNNKLQEYIPRNIPCVMSRVTFTKEAIDILKKYPYQTKAILVNQNKHMAMESISQLYHLGISNIEFEPYYPEISQVPKVDLAFAPGEIRYIPDNISKKVNLGCRKLSSETISEIALKLNYPEFLESIKFKNYEKSLASVDYSIGKLSFHSVTLENILNGIINSLKTGIVVTDENNTIKIVNSEVLDILQLNEKQMIGQYANKILSFINIDSCNDKYSYKEPKLVHYKNLNINVEIIPLYVKNQYIGSFTVIEKFEENERRQNNLRLQLYSRGYSAKYTFEDIVGESCKINNAKTIAKRMSKNDSSVLLEGESGTGKELFAHSIHNASLRKNNPFIAVNCAALPETLLESELFGYESGAFTGAKKGGKSGIFEYANGGTIFLDEIENMSTSLQAKLLRVLQEHEVVRIGSNYAIAVDVRIISASNVNLFDLMQKGKFRSDLYYRLSVMPIVIPPLRERIGDIPVLIKYFQNTMNTSFSFSREAEKSLANYIWPGNVRELRNCVEYLKCMNLGIVYPEDLPRGITNLSNTHTETEATIKMDNESIDRIVLKSIEFLSHNGKTAGRQNINEYCNIQGVKISEYYIKNSLKRLSNCGLIKINIGRRGSCITNNGKKYLNSEYNYH